MLWESRVWRALRCLLNAARPTGIVDPRPAVFDAGLDPGSLTPMSRTSALLASLADEPASTSEIYDRVGSLTLTRLGLVPYQTFRAELAKLCAAGLVVSHISGDGVTMWRLPHGSARREGDTRVTRLTPRAD